MIDIVVSMILLLPSRRPRRCILFFFGIIITIINTFTSTSIHTTTSTITKGVFVSAWEECGHGIWCPDGNTCCVNIDDNNSSISGCIPNDMGSYNATCCSDQQTGCPVGYKCRISDDDKIGDNIDYNGFNDGNGYGDGDDCVATSNAPMADDFVQVLPRYKLCRVTQNLTQLYGFEIINNKTTVADNDNGDGDEMMVRKMRSTGISTTISKTNFIRSADRGVGIKGGVNEDNKKLAYYSSHGPIMINEDPHQTTSIINDATTTKTSTASTTLQESVDMIWIVVHGSGRNADDYFCSALAAVEEQNTWNNVWVIAPKFLEDIDFDDTQSSKNHDTHSDHKNNAHNDLELSNTKEYLYWSHADGDGPWRYGANSMNGGGISSFTALDQLVKHLWEVLPDLQQMVIAGHSSGGQFVQRWSLLTQSWMINKNNSRDHHGKMKAIVANPSSFIYLTPLRWMNDRQEWVVPSKDSCPDYNKWQWGLEDGGSLHVPYRDEALKKRSSIEAIIQEYQDRHIIYVSGSLDQCASRSVRSGREEDTIMKADSCHSHGIETTCMDELQGRNRLERSSTYFRSLTEVVSPSSLHSGRGESKWRNHIHQIVPGVGHDHSLIWTRPEGIDAIFGPVSEDSSKEEGNGLVVFDTASNAHWT
jgi:hypothetical protein